MTILNVPDMHCEMCVKRIDRALDACGIAHRTELKSKTVAVDGVKVTAAKQALEELGFTAEE